MLDAAIRLGGKPGALRGIFLYSIPTPQTYTLAGGGTGTIVPTPSSEAPQEVLEQLTAAEIADLDAGLGAYEVVVYGDEANQNTLAVEHARRKALLTAAVQDQYRQRGQRVNF